MNVALVHDWLTGMRGGERCLEVLCDIFPEAPIFTLFYVKGRMSPVIERHPIRVSYLNGFPWVKSRYPYFLPLFPSAIRRWDFQQYDLVVSSSHCVVKGIGVPERTCHISYIHTPMRYLWDQFEDYFGKARPINIPKLGMSLFRHRLQQWDRQSNGQVHEFIANSRNVAERVMRLYGRSAGVVYPPVEWHAFQASHKHEGFYLMVTAFAPYKRVDLAIQAANDLKVPLKIVGRGQDEKRLRHLAGPTVEFLGWQPDQRVRELYSRCLAVLFPGEEDFGIVPLEAMAAGKPVIAYGKGGALETIIPLNPHPVWGGRPGADGEATTATLNRLMNAGCSADPHPSPLPATGVFFYKPSVQPLVEAIRLFEQHQRDFDPDAIRAHVEPFDRVHCQQHLHHRIMTAYEHFCRTRPC